MLLDNFHRVHDYLRISLTEKCNLRCSYCMPEEGVALRDRSFFMNKNEVVELAKTFVSLGVKKIRLTGGEPLTCKDAHEIICNLSKIKTPLSSSPSPPRSAIALREGESERKFPFEGGKGDVRVRSGEVELAITTNGILADEYLETFRIAKISSVNVSLDTLNPQKFISITRRNNFEKVFSNIHLLLRNNFHVKVNVVVMRGVNDDEIIDFIEWTKKIPIHIRLIEFMPFSGNRWEIQKVVAHCTVLKNIQEKFDIAKLEDAQHDVGKKYKIIGYEGTFALISAITEPFCFDCNRLRLTADGKLRNCLFTNAETDLLTPLRNGEDIVPFIIQCMKEKEPERGGQFDFLQKNINKTVSPFPLRLKNRSMVTIGG